MSTQSNFNCFFFRYQRECGEMSEWLQSALERLEFWNTQAVLVPQELETVRDHLSAFLVRPKTINLVDLFCFCWPTSCLT